MEEGDLVYDPSNGYGLVLNSSPTIGTRIRMVEVFWGCSEMVNLYSEKSLVLMCRLN